MNRTPLSRRMALRGAAACIALPLLEAMLPQGLSAQQPSANAAAGRKPRMVCCYVPYGVNNKEWKPANTGPGWTPSPTLEAIKDYRADLTVLTGLWHPKARGGHAGADTWLTGADLEGAPGKDYQNSVSVDQLAADLHGKQTRIPSLELSDRPGTGSAGHSQTLSFDHAGTPLPAENSPQRVFERLFAPEDPASRAATLRRYAERRSILDDILGDARSLNRQLGKSDQRKLDEYLASVRQAEERVAGLERWIDVPKPRVSRDGLNLNVNPFGLQQAAWIDAMLDLCFLALQTDTTRVITFEWAGEGAGFRGSGVDHHELSHHGGRPQSLAQLAEIDRILVGKLARFLGRLRGAAEGGGNLLDTTMVLYGSGMNNGEGGGHSPKDLPLLLAGGKELGLKHGSHLKFEGESTPMSNLLLTMLQAMGVEQPRFQDSTGPLNGLT